MKNIWKPSALWIVLLLMITAFTASCNAGQTGNPGSTAPPWNRQDLQQIVDDWRSQSHVPGVVVGLSLPDHSEMILTSGESDTRNHIAIEADDQFQIASITKTFIAAEVLKLASEGKLGLDNPLNDHLSQIPYGDIVTIRHLLSHRSGYFDPLHDDPGFIPYLAQDLARQWSWQEMLAITFEHDLFFTPGSDYRYSNANYLILALVIEEITRQPLGEVLTASLISPLQLAHTHYRTLETNVRNTDLVHGYATHPVTGEVVDTMSIPNTAILSVSTDTMISNASDLLRWSRALYGNRSTLLDSAYKQQMLTFDTISPYGLGVFRFQTPLGMSFGHGGDTAGYLSLMEYHPNQDMAIVILVNADAASINLSGLRDELLARVFALDGQTGIKKLVADLQSKDPSVRKDAIIALGHSGSNSEEAIRGLIAILKEDLVAENRKEAVLALGFVGKDSGEAEQALNEALNDQDESVREAVKLVLNVFE